MTQHQPNPSALRSLGSRGLPVPAYLSAHYWWAYVHPNAVQVFERQWLVNLILWGNYPRLSTAALGALGSPIRGSVLQIACAYGDITPRMVASWMRMHRWMLSTFFPSSSAIWLPSSNQMIVFTCTV